MVRTFDTGATRSEDAGRTMYPGYFSFLVMERFGEYMTRHRIQEDGSLRDPDNWKKGMPTNSYRDGLFRHHQHLQLRMDGFQPNDPKAEPGIEDDLCAIIFNAQGLLHETLKQRRMGVVSRIVAEAFKEMR